MLAELRQMLPVRGSVEGSKSEPREFAIEKAFVERCLGAARGDMLAYRGRASRTARITPHAKSGWALLLF
jgi:hypothetical protein